MPQSDHDRPADELVSLLARRIEVLECLLDEPHTRPELVEALDISRSTVDRAVRELEGMDLLEFDAGVYRASLPGRLAHAEYAELRGELVTVEEASDLLAVLPPTAPLELEVLQGAEVVVGTDPAPHVPGSRIPELIRGADNIRSLSVAFTTPATGDAVATGVREEEMTVDVVFARELYEYLSDSDAMDLPGLIATDQFNPWVIDDLPFGLLLITQNGSQTVCIAVYDADRTLAGIIINDSSAAIDWAASIFDRYQASATRIE